MRAPSRPALLRGEGYAAIGDVASAPDSLWGGVFRAPRAIIRAASLDEVAHVVQRADAEARAGAWVVLVLAYEAAPACDLALVVRAGAPAAVPFAWAAVYDTRLDKEPDDVSSHAAATGPSPDWVPVLDAAAFAAKIDTLHAHIAAGDSYQVNFTFPMLAVLPPEEAEPWFRQRRQRARAPHAAFIDMGAHLVMSLSPELFLERRGTRILTRPMKGTQARGRWPEEDAAAREALRTSEKARAENTMIVDLLRNDLGRLAETGSVRVTELCAIEAYPTVWQMTSTIEAEVSRDRTLWEVLQALFPCGSVTGAPKVRTMEVIAAEECAPRGVYTGAIGLLRPGGDAIFSVPIRTVVVDRTTGAATLGVGAGITADSIAADEYAECLLKAEFARSEPAAEAPGLFETLRLEAGEYWLRERHLARLRASAQMLGLPYVDAHLGAALDETAAAYPEGCWRVRLVLAASGEITCRASSHDGEQRGPWRVGFAPMPVSSRDRRLFHKTLDRSIHDGARGARPELDDVILWNEHDQVTESSIANLVVALDTERWTPPIACGLLPGTFRAHLLEAGEIRERVLTRADLRRADALWLVNSLRGWIPAVLVG